MFIFCLLQNEHCHWLYLIYGETVEPAFRFQKWQKHLPNTSKELGPVFCVTVRYCFSISPAPMTYNYVHYLATMLKSFLLPDDSLVEQFIIEKKIIIIKGKCKLSKLFWNISVDRKRNKMITWIQVAKIQSNLYQRNNFSSQLIDNTKIKCSITT